VSGRPRADGSPPPRATGGLEHLYVHLFRDPGQRVANRPAHTPRGGSRPRNGRAPQRPGSVAFVNDIREQQKARWGFRLTGPGRGACDPPANRHPSPLNGLVEGATSTIHFPNSVGRSGLAAGGVPPVSGLLWGLSASRSMLKPNRAQLRPIFASGRREAPALSSRRTQEPSFRQGRVEVAEPRPAGPTAPSIRCRMIPQPSGPRMSGKVGSAV
jgi:hypothetical protein